VDYKKPAALGDKLRIDGWLESLDRTRFWCGFEVVRLGDGQRIVTARQMLAMVQMPAGRPVRLPAEWQEKYSHLVRSK
jgi:acyl-CoA thioesterase FadM